MRRCKEYEGEGEKGAKVGEKVQRVGKVQRLVKRYKGCEGWCEEVCAKAV